MFSVSDVPLFVMLDTLHAGGSHWTICEKHTCIVGTAVGVKIIAGAEAGVRVKTGVAVRIFSGTVIGDGLVPLLQPDMRIKIIKTAVNAVNPLFFMIKLLYAGQAQA